MDRKQFTLRIPKARSVRADRIERRVGKPSETSDAGGRFCGSGLRWICTGTIRRIPIQRVSGWHGNLESGTRQPTSRIFPVRYAASAPSSSRGSRRCAEAVKIYKGRHSGDDEKASKPGMYEYQYKAEFDYALAQHGCLTGISDNHFRGSNNFCIPLL